MVTPAGRSPATLSLLRRVGRNAGAPMAAGVVNKVLDVAFAVLMLRLLGPTEVGRFTWAVLVVGYLDILINFGLGVLITRDVARDGSAANRYLGAGLAIRFVFWLLALAATLVIVGPLAEPLEITPAMAITLVALVVGIGISNLAGLASALFTAHERMEVPAGVTVFTAATKLAFGTTVLLLGYGIVGLGVASILSNLLTVAVLWTLAIHMLRVPRPVLEPACAARLLQDAAPLMVNNLLASVFFRVDGVLLRAVWGDRMLGWYGAAYKVVDGLNIIPSSFVLALFPIFSRASEADAGRPHADRLRNVVRPELYRSMLLSLRVLHIAAFPIAVGVTFLAVPIVELFAGDAFLPHGAIALQILIWFIPFGFTNGLLQYILIAVNQQRFITFAFVGAAAFNIGANLLVLPQWGYVGAAVVTVLSELVLLGPFLFLIARHVGPVSLLAIAWRPALAAAAMAPAVWAVGSWSAALAVPMGAAIYGAALLALRGVTRGELATLWSAWRQPPASATGPFTIP